MKLLIAAFASFWLPVMVMIKTGREPGERSEPECQRERLTTSPRHGRVPQKHRHRPFTRAIPPSRPNGGRRPAESDGRLSIGVAQLGSGPSGWNGVTTCHGGRHAGRGRAARAAPSAAAEYGWNSANWLTRTRPAALLSAVMQPIPPDRLSIEPGGQPQGCVALAVRSLARGGRQVPRWVTPGWESRPHARPGGLLRAGGLR